MYYPDVLIPFKNKRKVKKIFKEFVLTSYDSM